MILNSTFWIFLFFSNLLMPPPESLVSWDTLEHDFGIIDHKVPVQKTFVFTNESTDSIRLDNVRTTCGCTSPIWSNQYVMPGDTSHIVIEYDAQDTGEFYKQIKVFIRKQRKPEKLLIFGEVLP